MAREQSRLDELMALLTAKGVSAGVARRIAGLHPDRVERQVALFDARGKGPGALVRSIEEDWAPEETPQDAPAPVFDKSKFFRGKYAACPVCGGRPCVPGCEGVVEEDERVVSPPVEDEPTPMRPTPDPAPTVYIPPRIYDGPPAPLHREKETDVPDSPIRFKRVKVNYTMVPHMVFKLPSTHELEPHEQVILFQILRQTFGYHYESAVLKTKDLAEAARVSYPTCRRALVLLETKGLIRRERQTDERGHRVADLITLTLPGVEVE